MNLIQRMLILTILFLAISSAHAQSFPTWRLNVYGASYHPDKEAAKKWNTENQENPGLGINYTFANGVFTEAGFYKDSGQATARFANVGYYYPIMDSRFLIGGALTLMRSDTYNEGRTFIAPIPSAAVDFKAFRIHAVWFPKVPGFNEVAAFGFYVSVPFGGKPDQ